MMRTVLFFRNPMRSHLTWSSSCGGQRESPLLRGNPTYYEHACIPSQRYSLIFYALGELYQLHSNLYETLFVNKFSVSFHLRIDFNVERTLNYSDISTNSVISAPPPGPCGDVGASTFFGFLKDHRLRQE